MGKVRNRFPACLVTDDLKKYSLEGIKEEQKHCQLKARPKGMELSSYIELNELLDRTDQAVTSTVIKTFK